MKMRMIQLLENAFERLGRFIARNPGIVIISCLLFTGLCSIGFINIKFNSDVYSIWDTNPTRKPDGSQAVANKQWVSDRIVDNKRTHTLIFKAIEPNGNILTPKALRVMLDIHKAISEPLQNISFSDICYRIPVPDIFGQRGETCGETDENNNLTISSDNISTSDSEYDYSYDYYQSEYYSDVSSNTTGKECNEVRNFNGSVFEDVQRNTYKNLPRNVYCELINTLETQCLEQSLLEIWMYNENIIKKVNQQDIINAINLLDKSPYFGFKFNYAELLGSIKRNETGHIISAKAALYNLATVVDLNKIKRRSFLARGAGQQLTMDEPNIVWQDEAIKILLDRNDLYSATKDVSIDINMSKSIDDLMGETLFLDLKNVFFCFLVMYIYTSVMLNASSCSDMRLFLTAIGLFSVILGVIIAIGITSAIGYAYMPHFAMLPFLLVGLGIDDMFVIMQVFRNLEGTTKESNIEERIGLTLRHAGVAISVTSLTDICAFGVGAITVFPALQAFCVTCSLGIAAIYALQVTWFVAWLVIDEKRKQKETQCFPKCKEKLQSCPVTKYKLIQKIWPAFSNLLEFKIYHIFVAMAGATFLGFGTWGCLTIKQEFDLSKFYPSGSYLRTWGNDFYQHFHDWELGFAIYSGTLQTKEDFVYIDNVTKTLSNWIENDQVLVSMDNWWQQFNHHINDYWNITDWKVLFDDSADDKDFQYYLSEFLHSPSGGKYIANLRFNESLTCNRPSPLVTASIVPIKFSRGSSGDKNEGENDNRNTLETFIGTLNTTEKLFSYGTYYIVWDVNEHVGFELWRNLGVAMLCVFVVTLILLNNFPACTFVNLSVICTVVDVIGFVRFWDITIDVASLCTIVVVVGICVDYPVHIIHCYLISKGSKLQRAKTSLITIGPAVTNGGMTTFLSVIMLCGSQSHIFITFWKIFCLTVLFGLFHGVILLPVVLCYLGPSEKEETENKSEKRGEINNALEKDATDIA